MEAKENKVRPEHHPPVACWFCDARLPVATLLKDGILISREPQAGGPYFVFLCSSCLKEGMLEETPRGRWFSSPNVKVGLLDYLFRPGEGDDSQSEIILKALSWLRENEERRRYFFERDGDRRYSGFSVLRKLWPWGRVEPDAAQAGEPKRGRPTGRRRAAGASDSDGASAAGAGAGHGRAERPRRPPRPRILSPQEVLGVSADASAEEITRRFRLLAVQYHPDKVHHLGPEFQRMAHIKFIELQRAYDTLLARAPGRDHPRQ